MTVTRSDGSSWRDIETAILGRVSIGESGNSVAIDSLMAWGGLVPPGVHSNVVFE
jgi:hypothetical protein